MRITITLILALILAIIVTIFAVQNNTQININFLAWDVDGSLALILMITFALGIFIGLLVTAPAWFRRVRQSAELKKNIQTLEKDLEKVRMETDKPSTGEPGKVPVAEIAHEDDSKKEIIEDSSRDVADKNEVG
jgi:putative membrane protein